MNAEFLYKGPDSDTLVRRGFFNWRSKSGDFSLEIFLVTGLAKLTEVKK